MLPPRCMLSSLRSAPSCHRFDQVQASPALCPVSPVAPAVRCKPCPVALVPTLGCSRPPSRNLDLLRSAVRTFNTRLNVYFKVKTVLKFLGHVRLSARKETSAHPDAFAHSWPSLGRRGARRPDSPLVHPGARTHGEIWGRNAPARFRHGASVLSSV